MDEIPSLRDTRPDQITDELMRDLQLKLTSDVLQKVRDMAELVDLSPDQAGELLGVAAATLLLAVALSMKLKFGVSDEIALKILVRELPTIITSLQNSPNVRAQMRELMKNVRL